MKLNANDRKQIKDFIKEKRCYFLKKNNPFSNIKVTNEGKIQFFVKTNSTLNYYKSGGYPYNLLSIYCIQHERCVQLLNKTPYTVYS